MTGKPVCDGGPQGVCELRGQQHPACSGHPKQGPNAGQACPNPPVTGLHICRMHGVTKAARAKGQQIVTEQRARKQLSILGEPVPVDAIQAFQDLLMWKHAEILALRARVDMLSDDDATWGTVESRDATGGENPGTTTTERAEPNIWWRMLRTAEAQLADIAAGAARAGIDERRQRLAEDQGRFAIAVLKRAIDGLLAALIAAGLERQLVEAWPRLVAEVVPSAIKEIAAQQEGTNP